MTTPTERQAPERFRARGLDAWAEILQATHVGFDVQSKQTPFHGVVSRRRFGDLMLVDCASAPWIGHRDEAIVDGAPVVGFQSLRKGVEQVRERDRRVDLIPGDVVIWNGWQPVDVEVPEPFFKRTLILPRDRALAVIPRLAEVGDVPPLNGNGAARLLVRYLDAIALELPRLDEAARAAAADAALELLRAAVEPSLPSARAAKREALRTEVRRYVRVHLQDPALGPETIARAQAISIRALHALFEDTGESVAAVVRRERLARCREDLQRPAGGSVTEIAFRWGFRDAAHFTRAFKREYGVTPSDVRAHGQEVRH
jgi:AraC family transcriptional regulator, positive regulator of tynA and feaB